MTFASGFKRKSREYLLPREIINQKCLLVDSYCFFSGASSLFFFFFLKVSRNFSLQCKLELTLFTSRSIQRVYSTPIEFFVHLKGKTRQRHNIVRKFQLIKVELKKKIDVLVPFPRSFISITNRREEKKKSTRNKRNRLLYLLSRMLMYWNYFFFFFALTRQWKIEFSFERVILIKIRSSIADERG